MQPYSKYRKTFEIRAAEGGAPNIPFLSDGYDAAEEPG